jgi:hypothetical protein
MFQENQKLVKQHLVLSQKCIKLILNTNRSRINGTGGGRNVKGASLSQSGYRHIIIIGGITSPSITAYYWLKVTFRAP